MFLHSKLNPFPNISSKFGQQIAPLLFCLLVILRELSDFALAQGGQLPFNTGNAFPSLADLADDADEFGPDSFTRNRIRAIVIFGKDATEGIGVAGPVGAICLCHESSAEVAVSGILGEVGMYVLGDFAEQALEFGRWGKVRGLGCLAMGGFVGLACLFASFF